METRAIVVGIDGSSLAAEALEWAVEEAQLRGAGLSVVHAWRPGMHLPAPRASDAAAREAEASAEAILSNSVQSLAGRVSVATILVKGAAAPSLLNQSTTADLLVVGSRGRGGFAGLVLGSVSQHCMTHARCPVAVVRRPDGDIEPRVVVGVDGSPESREALRWAMDAARIHHARLEAVAAWSRPWPGPRPKFDLPADLVKKRAVTALEAAIGTVVGDEIAVERTVVEDRPALALVEAAKGASLLVVGSRGLGGFAGLTLGSVSQACAHHAPCPIVIVRGAPQKAASKGGQ